MLWLRNTIVVLQTSWISTVLPLVEDCETTATTGTKLWRLFRGKWEDDLEIIMDDLKFVILRLKIYSTEFTEFIYLVLHLQHWFLVARNYIKEIHCTQGAI